MKKLVLAAILGLGVFGMLGVASLNAAENLSKEQFVQFVVDCLDNENVRSCQRLANSGDLTSAEQCNKEACNNIGLVYYAAENYQQAFKYYKKACELNDKFGCFNLGVMYAEGQGVRQDFASARKYYEKACNANNTAACDKLGLLYYDGKGVRQDFASAKKYWEKACNKNDALACGMLGVLYYEGQGVKQNLSTAKQYYGKACDLGSQNGCDNYKILNEQGVK